MFWIKEQYLKFAEVMMDKPLSFYTFEMLYCCDIREGELLVLISADFYFEKRTVSINKSYQRLNGEDLITISRRKRAIGSDDWMFTVTNSYLYREMDRGAKDAGVPRIRIHDIRHSSVSLLINMGLSATAIETGWAMRASTLLTTTLTCFRPSRRKWRIN